MKTKMELVRYVRYIARMEADTRSIPKGFTTERREARIRRIARAESEALARLATLDSMASTVLEVFKTEASDHEFRLYMRSFERDLAKFKNKLG